ncbi:symmetrical bis(5'-nucleosyl)-tetraphosphatase [secondary endosymbiont of Heteropsylla cubana]|uniref:Bis(5'-nucleosyl)-tetraphosphatase, symmetrical n=1 Tax=secondary endosymbiont of Heteropsylla cubana TaxID=134287 RepID=J3Z554_9ENTR|nr:bis(5'-nucleosyl)-tetraphosphatase (symmetrical) ApaH [secondary endosymbiont of Heteropsylla cubana]AFP85434.1 symmetrical bis(5'-nucleosyl)-tetraphosphatase [secondary endosymbiont of Heteropsylla cubana]
MSTYLIGDIHGCYNEFNMILDQVSFNPEIDTLWVTGDLISRKINSIKVIRLLYSIRKSVRLVLGNHDLHFLSLYYCANQNHETTLINPNILVSTDIDKLIHWLRNQPMLQIDEEKYIIMTHAGITPQWDISIARRCAHELETMLKSDDYHLFLQAMYGDTPNQWSEKLSGLERLRFIANAFTRIRYCFLDGQLEMSYKGIPREAPSNLFPWFKLIRPEILGNYNIIFGHWASLMGRGTPTNIYGLDTGCCWGKKMTLLRWEDKMFTYVPALLNT